MFRAALAAVLLASAPAQAAVIYAADFESYSTGGMTGQDGWIDLGGGSHYNVVANTVPGWNIAGTQTLAVSGGNSGAGFVRHLTSSTGITSGTVVLEADVLPDPAKTTGLLLVSIGTGAGAYFYFRDSGRIEVWNGAGLVDTGVAYAERAYHVRISLDIDADRYSVELDGAPFLAGLDSRLTPGPLAPIEVLELYTFDGAPQNVAYIDNIVITANVPAPGTLALLALALALASGASGVSRPR